MEPTFEVVSQKVIDILANAMKVGTDQVTIDTDLVSDLAADSFDALTIAVDLEQAFGLKLQDVSIETLRSPRTIAYALLNRYVMRLVSNDD
jgi:acyl carrier protein